MASCLSELREFDYAVTDSNVYDLYKDHLPAKTFVFPAGESSKSLPTYMELVSWLAKQGVKRRDTLVAIGGGVTGDLAGFAAATYMRGIDFVLVPTSLLAMVDSSIGGKVGIDLPEGKNLLGSFWPPKKVLLSTGFLVTLPEREILSGTAEIWKIAAIADRDMFECLETFGKVDQQNFGNVVEQCVRQKAQIVIEDEFETTGKRAILNFGHTVGHAVEAELGYGTWTHGEAIAAGMVAEAVLGEALGFTENGSAARIRSCLDKQGLPTEIPATCNANNLVEYMWRDKKSNSTSMSFSLLTSIGQCKLVNGIHEKDVKAMLRKS